MKPLTYYEQIIKMPNKADKFDLRLRIVKSAVSIGIKPTARLFDTTPKTVRKWLNRYKQERLAGLNELPRTPMFCPHRTNPALERRIVLLRKRFGFMGAARLKKEHRLPVSHTAINRILRENGLIEKRRKKHKRKKDLSEIKKRWKLFGQITVDTKELKDIPHYWPQMKNLKLPKYQFTAREVRSGNTGYVYVDGALRGTYQAGFSLGSITRWSIGQEWDSGGPGAHLAGTVDDARIYNRALTAEEIRKVMMGIPPGAAFNPSPPDEAADVSRDVTFSWSPGEYASLMNGHKFYLSENFNDVNNGIGGITQSATSYAPAQRLDFGTTYYWRVDEVNGPPDYTVYEGKVWSFTTELFAYPIENVAATASSASQKEMGPENTINSSGLDDNDLHSNKEKDIWLSGTEPLGAWIKYEFDKVYNLYQMWVWNSNQTVESILGFGVKDVTIDYSTNGTDYTTLGTTHQFARAPGTSGYAHNTIIDFAGVRAKYVRLTANSNWGGIMPQYGLSEVRFFQIPVSARNPYPNSGATGVDVDVVLGWTAGREAVTHDVYVSADEQAVIDGTAPITTVTETSHGPLALDLDTTYYWKVNEVNEAQTPSTWESAIWSFTTTDHLIVDDFESYNNLNPEDPKSNRIFSVWIDGYEMPANGSLVGYDNPPFCERTIVHAGKQSMPFFYSNTSGAAYSEAELPLSPPQNWTEAGAAIFVLYFHGTEGNTGQLYVKLNGSKVVYDGNAGDIAKVEWKQWNIEIASLGVNLQNVTKLAIGIDGNGAGGTLYVDDIGLYASAPETKAN